MVKKLKTAFRLSKWELYICSDDISCSKDNEYVVHTSGVEEYGFATDTVNGKDWRASTSWINEELLSDTLFAIGFSTFEGN